MRFFYTVTLSLIFLQPFQFIKSQVCINEYLSLNINGILDEDHAYTDWIEIYNNTDGPVDITGFGLSDDPSIVKWTFPAAVLPGRQHLLIFASGKDRKQMPMQFETIIDVGEDWRYLVPSSDIGATWHAQGYDDSSWQTGSSSFGYSDNDDTTQISASARSLFIRKEFTVTDVANLARLILTVDYDDGFVAYINGHEVARSNFGNPGEYMSWDRLALNSHEAAMYSGGDPEYFEISNPISVLNEGTNIIAIQVHNNIATSSDMSLVPFLTTGKLTEGADHISPFLEFPSYGGLHTNFKMDADSESVYLFNQQGTLIDNTEQKNMPMDVSYGRNGDGSATWTFCGIPTPGATNNITYTGQVPADTVLFSPEGGIHFGGVSVSLSSAGGTSDSVYYTLDGSIPGKSDHLYEGPITVNNSTVIRARVLKFNRLPGTVGSRTYITALNHEVPVVCLTTEPFNLWDNLAGIYAFGPNTPTQDPYPEANFWQDWERPVHIELYDTEGIRQIDQGAGMKIFGGWSRASPQKSVSLFARKEYGKGSFKYQIFNTKSIDKFESVVLRNSGNDNMGLQFHDCFMTGLARDMDIDVQAYQPAAIYLNGEYWGLLNIREKVSDNYVAENYLINADSVNLLEYNGQIIDGTNTDYVELRDFMYQKSTLQSSADFNFVSDKMEIDNFIRYQILNIYLNNRDWPGNNIKYWNTTAPGSKWRWISFDTDFGFGIWDVNDYQINTLEFALEPNGPGWPNPEWSTLFLRRLVSNTGFRNNFINQFCDRLNQDFLPSRINADIDSLKTLYENEMVNTFNRWDSSYDDWLCNYNGWIERINNRKIFGQNRRSYCRQHLQSEFQLSTQQTISVNVSDRDAGFVKLNSISVKSYPFSGVYFRNVPISMTAIPKPGYKFTGWTGTVNSAEPKIAYNMASGGSFTANFTEATEEDFSVVINEINYSSSVSLNTKDWIELHNNGLTSVDLSGWLLTDTNIDSGFVFPAGIVLLPGSYLVVCKDLEDFRGHNPNVRNSIGEFGFGLSVDGDIVRLFDNHNNLIDAVNYGSAGLWPAEANATGKTLELKNPVMNNSLPESWHAMVNGGTPGMANTQDTTTTNLPDVLLTAGLQCFPNPFSDYTTISFLVELSGIYRLEVLDMQGRVIRLLHDGFLNPDSYWLDWNGDGSSSGGVYMVRLISGSAVATMKIVKL